jgi:hypothetical protein
VHLAAERDGALNVGRKASHRLRYGNTYLIGKVTDGGLGAHPDDILNRKVVAIECSLARLGIDGAGKGGNAVTEEVEERRVLTEVEGVVGIVEGRLHVTGEKDKALTYAAAKLLATR